MADPSGSTKPADRISALCRRRLLQDIKDFEENPYPKISLYTRDEDLAWGCLVLYPDNYDPIHMTINFGIEYPLLAPSIEMDSDVSHPNVYGKFICASILTNSDEYTPAYTLKGIAIQMLSFFDSANLDQDYGGSKNLQKYHDVGRHIKDTFQCRGCNFGLGPLTRARTQAVYSNPYDALVGNNPDEWPSLHGESSSHPVRLARELPYPRPINGSKRPASTKPMVARKLPTEILLRIVDYLDEFKDVVNFARAWPRISDMVRDFNIVRQRELQCFCLKTSYQSANLGVGVAIEKGRISSEFDLISWEAYNDLEVRRSVHNVPFQHWLPLPISRHHWKRVNSDASRSLTLLRPEIRPPGVSGPHVIFTFMNEIVVRLNLVAEGQRGHRPNRNTILHASEKAIESYFHLFHLLVCLATEDASIVRNANSLLENFARGRQSKAACPNLGHLLIALLISDLPVTEQLTKDIITEAITRNVVWLLDKKGARMPELSFLEAGEVSAYRLDKTFQGSRTSYRLLMFSELFRRTARPSQQKSLVQVRDELFDRLGAPPRDAANRLASEVRRLHAIDNFPAFMKEMGLRTVPSPENFTMVLRQTVTSSMNKGYSKWALPRHQALALRFRRDPSVFLTKAEVEWVAKNHSTTWAPLRDVSFFPDNRG